MAVDLESLEWVPVPASNVKQAAYRPKTKAFYLRFASGAVYVYAGVPVGIWERFQRDGCKAAFIYNEIRNCGGDDRYPCRLVE